MIWMKFTAFCDLRIRLATLRKSIRKFWFCKLASTCESVWPGLNSIADCTLSVGWNEETYSDPISAHELTKAKKGKVEIYWVSAELEVFTNSTQA